MYHVFFQLALTGGGRFAGVDMADDDDVAMSLILTAQMKDILATVFMVRSRLISKRKVERRQGCGDRLPHGGGWFERVWFEVL